MGAISESIYNEGNMFNIEIEAIAHYVRAVHAVRSNHYFCSYFICS